MSSSHTIDRTFSVEVFSSFQEAKASWSAFEKQADLWPFQTYDFLSTWDREVGAKSGVTPAIVLVQDSRGEPLMLMPLGIFQRGSMRVLEWLGGPAADYKAPLLAPNFEKRIKARSVDRLWHAVLKKLPQHDILHFDHEPAYIGRQGNPFTTLPTARSAVQSAHSATLGSDLESFLASKRSAKSRSQMRRKYNRLKDEGDVQFIMPREGADIARVMEVLFEQKSRAYRELNIPDLFEDSNYRNFYTALSLECIPTGFVHLSALTLNGEILAAHWGMVHRKSFYFILPSYTDGPHRKNSPGTGLLQHLFEWCHESGVERFDFTVGDEIYKEHWCDTVLPLFEQVRGVTALGKVHAQLRVATSEIKKAIVSSDLLWELVARGRAYLGGPRYQARSRPKTEDG